MKSDQIFEFNLSQTNRIKPRQIDKINVKTMIRNKEIDKINEVINDLSQENFDENGINYFSKNCYVDYFDLKKDDRKGLKTFQLLTQYMIYSINHLKKKQEIMNDLYNKQLGYNETADRIIYKQVMIVYKLE